jgi:glutamate N-acetyltransferase/amino-acid N-acetyltransferase
MKLPTGFEVSGTSAGIKPSGKADLGLIYSPHPLAWAMVATRNLVRAPCVARNHARFVTDQPVHALIVNSGNANAGTGDQGIWDNEDMAGAVANALALAKVHDALTASTGVIGQRLPIENIQAKMPELVQTLGPEIREFSDAILTTDTRPKRVAASLRSGARIVGVAKGSGMIHPDMGTLLAFIITDAIIPQKTLRALWPKIVDRSFNQVSVDGDTSTNDMALIFSSNQRRADPHEFRDALEAVCQKLAEKVARDGEGATTLITVQVKGGRNEDQALDAARAVASSNLVKTAVHGRDPNWGRVLSAIGTSGALPDLANLHISIQGDLVYLGQPQEFDPAELSRKMNAQEVVIEIDLAAGEATGTAWGCDLTAEYVSINALYTT